MNKFLLIALMAFPLSGYSQFVSGNVSYLYNLSLNAPTLGHGFQIGVGGENLLIKNTPFKLATRYQFSFIKPTYTTRIENIEFDLPESTENLGFGDIDFKTLASEVSVDLGYQAQEHSLFEPYLSFGLRLSNTVSSISYALYNQTECDCYDNSSEKFLKNRSLGVMTGMGVKIRATESFYIDFRTNYLNVWGLSKNTERNTPDYTTAYIDNYGEPRFESAQSNYYNALNFSIGLIFRVNRDNREDDSWYYTSGKKSNRKSNQNSSIDSEDDSSSGTYTEKSTKSEEPCEPVELTPKGRGGG